VRYWWVNQNQTYRHEFAGGYLWSPKRKANGARNPFYEFMREVAPGDVVFSFSDTLIPAIGIARTYCYESPKPQEFGTAGLNWSAIGWKVDVAFRALDKPIRPSEHMSRLRPLLPEKYFPLNPETGHGLQSVYLTEVPAAMGLALLTLIGSEATQVRDAAQAVATASRESPAPEPTLEEWEQRVESNIVTSATLTDTERQALVMARRGQGLFRQQVQKVEKACRITKVDRPEHLIASHAKPWRDSTNDERLDGENGLLLTPTVDHLFDRGFISFEGNGQLIVSPVAHAESLRRMGVDPAKPVSVGAFSEGQRRYLEYHRENVLRLAGVRR
jgi:putative restriction endonuclease